MRIRPYELHHSMYKSFAYDHCPAGVTSSSTSAETDGDGTWNSGCEQGLAAASIPRAFQALMASEGGKAWWTNPGYHSETEEMEQGCSHDETTKESTSEEMDHQLHLLKSLGSSAATKLCPRGHWRPAEDEKLRALVSHYGPQNWNLIAEKLHGRSGSAHGIFACWLAGIELWVLFKETAADHACQSGYDACKSHWKKS